MKSKEITIDFNTAVNRMRRLLEQQLELAADLAELMTLCRVSEINGALLKKWLKAELADENSKKTKRIRKLIQDTEDQAIYGDALGHQIGTLQNSTKKVLEEDARKIVETADGTKHDASTGEVIEDDGCPKDDPDCLGNNGDCHDACERPAMVAAFPGSGLSDPGPIPTFLDRRH